MSEKVTANQIKGVKISKPTAPVKAVPRLQKSKVKSPVPLSRGALATPRCTINRKAFLKSCLHWLIQTIIYSVVILACMFLCDYILPILFIPVLIIGCIVKFVKVDWKLLVVQCHRLNDAGFNGLAVMIVAYTLESILNWLVLFNYLSVSFGQILGGLLAVMYVVLLFLPSRSSTTPSEI